MKNGKNVIIKIYPHSLYYVRWILLWDDTCLCKANSVVQSQKAVSAHFTSEQILLFDFARQYLWRSNRKSVENLLLQKNFAGVFSFVQMRQKQGAVKWNESGFRSPLCTHRLNWARRTSWGLWDEWDDTVLQTQDSKFEPWRSKAEHATSRSRRLPTVLHVDGEETFLFLSNRWDREPNTEL